MDQKKDRNVIILAIHPSYAHAVMSGNKTVEYRRNGVPVTVTHIVIYSTSPDQKILGFCEVVSCVEASPKELWNKFGLQGHISHAQFNAYFKGCAKGKCYVLSNPQIFSTPLLLKDCWSLSRPPQSFAYLTKNEWQRLKKRKKITPKKA